jgi:nitrate reductase gamma subunit
MTRFFLDLNGLLFDPARGTDRVVAGLLLVAALAAPTGGGAGFACLVAAVLLLSRRIA